MLAQETHFAPATAALVPSSSFGGSGLLIVPLRTPSSAVTQRLTQAARPQVLGERMVLAATGAGGLATIALRPSGIFGERDPLLVPLTVAKARQGKMKYVIGSGANLMDFTYVGNVAQAHVLVRLAWMHTWCEPGLEGRFDL